MSADTRNRITENTWVPLGAAAAVIVAITVATWRISTAFHEMKEAINAANSDRWTGRDMTDFARELERNNAKLQLNVPDPRGIQRLNASVR